MIRSHGRRTLSVIFPAHNEEAVIATAIASLQRQSHLPDEIVVVCNGCTDRTAEIAESLGCRVEITTTKGVSHARNLGARTAAGEFLLFLDADVVVPGGLIARLRRVLVRSRRVVGTVRAVADRTRYAPLYMVGGLIIRAMQGASNGIVFCSRNVFERAGGFPEELRVGEDNAFMKHARRLARVHYHYCVAPPVVTSTRRLARWGVARLLFTWVRAEVSGGRGRTPYGIVR